jgi:hypothetical protein
MTLLTQHEVDVLHQNEELIVRRQMNPQLKNETYWALERIRLHIIRAIQQDENALNSILATREQERWAHKAHVSGKTSAVSTIFWREQRGDQLRSKHDGGRKPDCRGARNARGGWQYRHRRAPL